MVKAATKFLDTTAGKVVAGGAIAAGAGALRGRQATPPLPGAGDPARQVHAGAVRQGDRRGTPQRSDVRRAVTDLQGAGAEGQGRADREGPDRRRHRAAARAQHGHVQAPGPEASRSRPTSRPRSRSVLAQQSKRFGTSTLLPLRPGWQAEDRGAPDGRAGRRTRGRKKEEAPVQREAATQPATQDRDAGLDTSGVDAAVRGGGRPLDPSVRRSMEAAVRLGLRFGAGPRRPAAASAAGDLARAAFTVGEDIVFGSDGYDHARRPAATSSPTSSPTSSSSAAGRGGRDPAGAATRLPRVRSASCSASPRAPGATGSCAPTSTRSPRAARSTAPSTPTTRPGRSSAGGSSPPPGYDLLGRQKALLIDEMLDGPTFDDDEHVHPRPARALRRRRPAGDLRPAAAADRRPRQRPARRRAEAARRLRRQPVPGRPRRAAGRAGPGVGSVVPAAGAHGFDRRATLDARLDSDRTPAGAASRSSTGSPRPTDPRRSTT